MIILWKFFHYVGESGGQNLTEKCSRIYELFTDYINFVHGKFNTLNHTENLITVIRGENNSYWF